MLFNKLTMSTLNLKLILQNTGLSEKQLADVLFPNHTHPKLALRYLVQGRRELKESEIEKLTAILSCPLDFVLNDDSWKAIMQGSEIIFKKKEYEAFYDGAANSAVLLCNGKPIGEKLFIAQTITLSDFLKTLDFLISNKPSHE